MSIDFDIHILGLDDQRHPANAQSLPCEMDKNMTANACMGCYWRGTCDSPEYIEDEDGIIIKI